LEESKWQIRTLLHYIKISLSADIVAAYVSRKSVTPNGLPALIQSVHGALSKLGALETVPNNELIDRLHVGSKPVGNSAIAILAHLHGIRRSCDRDCLGHVASHDSTLPQHLRVRRREAFHTEAKPRLKINDEGPFSACRAAEARAEAFS
jgi:hypothetical protein